MADLWYYGRGADLFGPFSGWQVADLADAGEVRTTDTVWEDGAEDGVPAHTIAHLFPAAVPVAPPAAPLPFPARMPAASRRAVAGPGAVITGQDGKTVRFLKKCTTCGKQDSSTSSAAIVRGTMRSGFYCPKCKRRRAVEIHGR
jgi:GYF domain 2